MKLYLKNNIINKSITDFTTDDIDIYCCSGGGYGDFFLTCVHKGLLYFLENDLTCKNILFYIWIFDYGIVDLFKNYNHNIYVCIETFSECEYNSQLMINLNEKFKSKLFDINKYYTIRSWFSNKQTEDNKYLYKKNTQFTPLEIENINIPINPSDNELLTNIKKNKYIVISFFSGDETRTVPYTLVEYFINNIDNSYDIILLGNSTATRINLKEYNFSHKNNLLDLINKTSLDLTVNIIKYSELVICSYSNVYLISALLNKKMLVFIPYIIVSHYREKEIEFNYKYTAQNYYLYSNRCNTILFNGSTYTIDNLNKINATFCEINDYKLEFNKILNITSENDVKEIIKKIKI